jgi:hypothetical protein
MVGEVSKTKSARKETQDGGNSKAAEAGFPPAAAEAAPKPREIVTYQRTPRVNLAELEGRKIVIIDYQLSSSARFNAQMAIIRYFTNPEGREQEAYTFSRVVIRQLTEEIDPLLKSGKAVEVKVVKTKRYLMLAPPE